MDIGPEGLLPFLVRDIADILERGLVGRIVDQRIVDQYVDAAETVDRLLDDRAAVPGVL